MSRDIIDLWVRPYGGEQSATFARWAAAGRDFFDLRDDLRIATDEAIYEATNIPGFYRHPPFSYRGLPHGRAK